MKIKKLFTIFICAALTFAMAGVAACNNGDPEKNGNVAEILNAPEIAINDNTGVISWNAVENADLYTVFEDNNEVSEQSATSYTVTQTVPGTYSYTVKASSSDGKYQTSGASNTVKYTVQQKSQQLGKPQVTFDADAKVISWTAVENANYYEIYENAGLVSRQTQISYTITQTLAGEYTYTVKAFSVLSKYSESEPSDGITVTVEETQDQRLLTAPVLELSGSVLSWNEVENADGYDIYENATRIASQQETSYTITQRNPGTYRYTVRATSNNENFITSAPSNAQTYTVNASTVVFMINVSIPAGINGLTVGLYNGNTLVASRNAVTGGTTYITATAGAYTVRMVALPGTLTATTAEVDANNTMASITVSLISSGSFIVGENAVRVNSESDEGVEHSYVFTAVKGGVYVVTTTETQSITIWAGEKMVIDAGQYLRAETFTAEEGEQVIFTVICSDTGIYTFNIAESGKIYFNIGTGYDDRPNMFVGAGTRYLKVDTAGSYIFHFGPTLSYYIVTIKINGNEYRFGSGTVSEEEETETNRLNIRQIELPAGEIEIEISMSDNYDNAVLGFFIYPAA